MIQRILNSKNFLALLLTMVTGMLLYFKLPWPMTTAFIPQTWNEYFPRLIALRDPWTYAGLKASYLTMLFTTPYIGYSFLLSALYIIALRPKGAVKPQALRPYPAIQTRSQLFVVVGEIHNPRQPIPAENPYWLTIPARGSFTGIIIIGATGAGKTACSMPDSQRFVGVTCRKRQALLPRARQLGSWRLEDQRHLHPDLRPNIHCLRLQWRGQRQSLRLRPSGGIWGLEQQISSQYQR